MELVASLDRRVSYATLILELSYILLAGKYSTFEKGYRLAVLSDRDQMLK